MEECLLSSEIPWLLTEITLSLAPFLVLNSAEMFQVTIPLEDQQLLTLILLFSLQQELLIKPTSLSSLVKSAMLTILDAHLDMLTHSLELL